MRDQATTVFILKYWIRIEDFVELTTRKVTKVESWIAAHLTNSLLAVDLEFDQGLTNSLTVTQIAIITITGAVAAIFA